MKTLLFLCFLTGVSATYQHFKATPLGKDYSGNLAVTKKTYKTCQRWDATTPHDPSKAAKDPNNFPDATIADAANYCRNPDSDSGGPWCYTRDPGIRHEYCNVGFKAHLKATPLGKDYMGNLAITKSGKKCQRWDSTTPHDPNDKSKNADNFPDKTIADAANYCRNPDEESDGPWCYTTDPGKEYDFCDVHLKLHFKTTSLGKEYKGDLAITKSGKKCQRWDSTTPHDPNAASKNADNFPDKTIADAANYCRNPDSSSGGPWCYTTDPGKRDEYCDVILKPRHITDASGEGTAPANTPCAIPWTYKGYTYKECTAMHRAALWCSTTSTWSGRWGNCQPGGRKPIEYDN